MNPIINQEIIDCKTSLIHDLYASGKRLLHIHRFADTDQEHIRRLLEWLSPKHGAQIIDMGCGFGEMARLMAEQRSDLQFTLLNLSGPQLEYAPAKFERIHGDFHAVDKPNASYDVVMFCFSIGHADIEKALSEAFRLLRVGGTLFIYDMNRVEGDNNKMEVLVSYRVHRFEQMSEWAKKAGFKLVLYVEPEGDDSTGREVCGDGYEDIFGGTVPAVWRFVK
jgi:ubiquinone/menaquinone biosynthesis C-methylase UbiE